MVVSRNFLFIRDNSTLKADKPYYENNEKVPGEHRPGNIMVLTRINS